MEVEIYYQTISLFNLPSGCGTFRDPAHLHYWG
jgi:hypothetical protein